MYFSPPHVQYYAEDTSPLTVDGGEVPFTTKFKYLSSTLSSSLTDDDEIDARVKAAAGAFASVRQNFFASQQIRSCHKSAAYEGLILSILLFGCETWAVTADLMRRLQSFHNRCVRTMCGITMWHTITHHIKQVSLESRLGLHPLGFYLARRKLAWAGHVARMDFNTRLPRKFLTSWGTG